MPIQIHRDVEYPFSFPHTPRHEDYALPVEGPEKTYAALRNCVLPGTVDVVGCMNGDVANSQEQSFASQPVSWHELLLETCTSINSGLSSPESSRPPSPTPLQSELASQPSSGRSPSSDPFTKRVMAKKRRSLQSILIPPFFHPALIASSSKPSSPTTTRPSSPSQSQTQGRFRSHSAAASTSHFVLPPAIPISPTSDTHDAQRNSPPSDLLSDDPFADLSPTPSTFILPSPTRVSSTLRPTLTLRDADPLTGSNFQTPRSPLAQSFIEANDEENEEAEEADTVSEIVTPWSSPPRTPPTTPLPSSDTTHILRRPKSSQIRPAYTRPAFTPRPSLPSLSTLAQRSIPIPRVKRGRVGAKLPVEPWALEDWECVDASYATEHPDGSDSRRASQITIKDSRLPQSPEPIPHSDYDQEGAPVLDDEQGSYFDLEFSESSIFEDDRRTIRARTLSRPLSDPSSSWFSTASSYSHATNSDNSSETSLPSTQPSNENLAAAYSRGAAVSVYGDLRSELDYDYLHAISRLDRTPSPEPYPIYSHPRNADGDGEAGTSAQAVRNLEPLSSMSHQRTISNTSIWTFNMADRASPPVTKPAFALSEQAETPSSVGSSDYDDEVEYFSFPSSSDRDSAYMSASASRVESFAGSSSFGVDAHAYGEGDDGGLQGSESESSSAPDITARLSPPPELLARVTCYYSAEELTDAGDSGHRAGRGSYGGHGGSQSQTNSGWQQSGGASSFGRYNGGGRMRNGSGSGGRDDEDDEKRPRGRPGLPVSGYVESSESESEDSSDEEENEHPRRGRPSLPKTAVPVDDPPSTDDDVPLAQRLPTALQAQKSIRRQVRAEHEQRKRARSVRRPGTADAPPEAPPPVPSGHAPSASFSSRTRKPSTPDPPAPPPIPSQPVARTRARTNTLPSKPSSPFSVGELTKKLLDVQASAPPLPSPRSHAARLPSQDPASFGPMSSKEGAGEFNHASASARGQAEHHQVPVKGSAPEAAVSRLRSMRSFHRPNNAADPGMAPASGGARLGRSVTSATRRRPAQEELPASPQFSSTTPAAFEHTRSTRSHSRRPSVDREPAPPPVPSPLPPREEGGADLQRKRSGRSQSRRPSVDRTRPSNDSARPPVPAFPGSASAPAKNQTAWHQRIFIGSLQRFAQVEMTSFYTARDILELLQNQGALDGGSATGWMLWEVCQDFGMERPIRSFEIASEVCNSWVADKTVNMLMAKKTPLAMKLSRAAIPVSSPVCSGWVQHEYKKGKWQKRWMELKEHSLWLSKREGGKDQTSLCSMNNFDAYVVTRNSKAPKGFVFAVKSTDNITYFESTSDYLHTFSVPEKEGDNWLEKILLARSYIIHQERNILTGGANAGGGGIGASLSRAGTRKRGAQPLVDFGRAAVTEPPPLTTPIFGPGSLLAKRV